MSNETESEGLMYSNIAVKEEKKYAVDTGSVPNHTDNGDDDANADNPYQKTDWKKRYDDLRRYQQQKQQEFEQREEELRQKVQQAQPHYEPPATAEELEAFKKDNPDVFKVARTVAQMARDEELKTLKADIEELQKMKTKATRDAEKAALLQIHPDAESIKKDPKFKEWAKSQPQEIQNWLFKSLDHKLTAKAINLFKLEHREVSDTSGEQPDKVEKDLSAADVVRAKAASTPAPKSGEKIWTRQELKALTPAQFEQHRKEIDEAFLQGRIK